MPVPVEKNLLYSYPQELCYGVIRDEVIPSINVSWKIDLLKMIKIPNGSIGLSIIEDDWRAYKLIVQMKQQGLRGLLGAKLGPPIKIYCRGTGPDTTMVEIVADSAQYFSSEFMNLLNDIIYKEIPLYSWVVSKTSLLIDLYFDQTLVCEGKKMGKESFGDELGRTALNYIFQKIHQILNQKLRALSEIRKK
jgi:hypothetical protein